MATSGDFQNVKNRAGEKLLIVSLRGSFQTDDALLHNETQTVKSKIKCNLVQVQFYLKFSAHFLHIFITPFHYTFSLHFHFQKRSREKSETVVLYTRLTSIGNEIENKISKIFF